MLRIFLDTEFTNLNERHLISIALVADRQDFYAEVDGFPVDRCSDFVQKTVLPQLGKAAAARMKPEVLRSALRGWLEQIRGDEPEVAVAFDYEGDWKLLIQAIGEAPVWLKAQDVRGNTDETVRKEFFNMTGLPEHHALYDAKALKFSFRQS